MSKRLTLNLLVLSILALFSSQSIYADSTTYDVAVYEVFTKTKVTADAPTDLYVLFIIMIPAI